MEKKDVIKHSAAVHIKNSVSILQRRAWNVLLAYAYDSLPDQDIHQIRLQDLRNTLNFASKNDLYLKQALERLVGCVVTWNTLHKDSTSWNASALLSHATIEDGICYYSYSSVLRKFLYNPRMYARISLSMQNKFSSKYSLALYEICVDYLNFDTGKGETPSISIPDLRTLMGLEEEEYPEFKKLNQKVIKPSVNELKQVSDIVVTVLYKRVSRKIDSVKFKVERKKKPIPTKSDQMPLKPLREITENHPLALRLQNDFCLTPRQSVVVMDKYPKDYISEILDMVEPDYKEGKIKNIAPYTLKALKEDYRNRKSSFEIEMEKKEQAARAAFQARLQAEEDYKKLQEEFSSFKKERSSHYLGSMEEGERLKVFEGFLSEHVEKNTFLRPILIKEGRDNSMIQSIFHEFVCNELLPEECSDFEVFSKMQGFSIPQDGEAVRIS